MKKKLLSLALLYACCNELLTPLQAQEKTAHNNRWAWKTNILEWATLIPNAGVEMDVSKSVYNKWTLGLQAAWNGKTNIKPKQKIQLGVCDIRVEGRRYFAPSTHVKHSKQRKNRFWGRYYWGLYTGYTDYKTIWEKGATGKAIHAGLTSGWQVQLYQNNSGGGFDLDLGASIGAVYTQYNRYGWKDGSMLLKEKVDWKWLPYPMLTELRLGIVYRFTSIRYKYNKSKPTH